MTPKRQKHNYTSELELKSLLIRIKNSREGITDKTFNNRINKYIKWHTKINEKKYKTDIARKNNIKNNIKDKIVELSEKTCVDRNSYERFGEIILLMIRKILTKPQFAGYTYKEDFYSDAVYKILKYLHNFKHDMISERTGQTVNSFAYISQYIHNSILFIINSKKKEHDKMKAHISFESVDHNIKDFTTNNESTYHVDEHKAMLVDEVILEDIDSSLYDELLKINTDDYDRVNVYYPYEYTIGFDEYNKIQDVLRCKISVIKSKKVEDE